MREQEDSPQPTQPSAPSPPRSEVRWEAGCAAIHPALDCEPTRRVAFVTLPLLLRDGGPAPRNGSPIVRARPYLIAVGPGFRNCLPLELTGLELATEPVFVETRSRWPQEKLKAFLENREAPPAIHDVYTGLVSLYERYLEFGIATEAKVCALWTMMTYTHPLFSAVPYLKLEGPRGSGKTKLASIVAHLSFNAVFASSLTPAAVFRIVHGSRSTLVGDEMEGLARNPQMTTLLNSGYKAGSFVIRAGAKGQLASYDSFSPKVLASIEPVSDTLASRAILIRLERGRDAARSRLAVTEDSDDWGGLRAGLYAWALTAWESLLSGTTQEIPGVGNSAAELWAPLMTIAAAIEPKNPGLVQELAAYASRTVAPAVPAPSFTPPERTVISVLARLGQNGRPQEMSTIEILAAVGPQEVQALGLSPNALGGVMRRWRLFTARRHCADGQRYVVDWGKVAELGVHIG